MNKLVILTAFVLIAGIMLPACASTPSSSAPSEGSAAPTASEPAAPAVDPNWPGKKSIQIVVPYATGGSPDVLMRAYAQYSELPIVVSNMPGSSGMVGTKHVINSEADGYTLLSMMPETLLTLYYGGDSGIHPSELDWVGCLAANYTTVATYPGAPFQTWEEMVEYAKARPGEVTVTSSGSKTMSETVMHIMNEAFGMELIWVPQASTVDARTAIMGHHNDILIVNSDEVATWVASGDMVGLLIAMDNPHPIMPELPLLKDILNDESMIYGTSRGILAPKGTPQEIMDIIYADMYKVSQNPDFQKAIADVGLNQRQLNGEEFAQIYIDMEPIMKEIWDRNK